MSDRPFVDSTLLQRAAQHCIQRLDKDPDNAVVLRSLAELHRKLGDFERAAAAYDRVFQLDPRDAQAGRLGGLLSGRESAVAPPGTQAAPFVVLKDFLPADLHEALLSLVISRPDRFVPGKLRGMETPGFRQALEWTGEWDGSKPFWNCLMDVLPRVTASLHLDASELDYRAAHLGVRAYTDGHFYKPHMDAPAKSAAYAHRVINFVYFLHRIPRPFTGGDLLLYDSDLEANTFLEDRFTRVMPEDNAIVFFPSAYWHSVLHVDSPSGDPGDSRFAIIGHFFKRLAHA